MKAVLVIDVPDNILLDFSKANIEIKESAYLVNKDESKWKYTKPIKIEDVPLRPLPLKETIKNEDEFMETYGWMQEVMTGMDIGWNDCIDSITGETE